jgi:hypothetical protein
LLISLISFGRKWSSPPVTSVCSEMFMWLKIDSEKRSFRIFLGEIF